LSCSCCNAHAWTRRPCFSSPRIASAHPRERDALTPWSEIEVKPFDSAEKLTGALARALEHKRLGDRNRYLERRLELAERYEGIVGTSRAIRNLVSLIESVAPSEATVLVLGESGTGKELVARAIHQRSRRATGPFVAVNCGAIAESLLESELFGHVKGAFTGALEGRKGIFEEAAKGTVFLDEVGELPLAIQVRLLRVLQEHKVKPVGANQERPVDVRIVAATNRDLSAEVSAGRFRQDLYYRLNVVAIETPPLRERLEDVALLAQHFLEKHGARHGRNVKTFAPGAIELLARYPWPGNVRELENVIERAVVLARGEVIGESELPSVVKGTAPMSTRTRAKTIDLPLAESRAEFERRYLSDLLARVNGNLSSAAKIAGLDRSNLRRLLRRHQIEVASMREGAQEDPGSD
jgi:two-component system response regulator HydG